MRQYMASGFLLLALAGTLRAAADESPVLRLEAGGPTSLITGLALSPDGQTLYAAGWDKVVRVWQRQKEAWVEQPAFRVPLGPGSDGKLNALAISADGQWLATAGLGLIRSRTGFKQTGFLIPSQALDPVTRQDQGTITLFHTKTREVRTLRGLQGGVFSLAFGTGGDAKTPPAVVAAARHWNEQTNRHLGALWLWESGQNVASGWPHELPDLRDQQLKRPGIVVEKTGNDLTVAFAWGDGKLRLWKGDEARTLDAGKNNIALLPGQPGAVRAGSSQIGSGYFQTWNNGQAGERWPGNLPAGVAFLPFAAAANKEDAVVAAFVKDNGPPQVRLHVIGLTGPDAGKLKVDRPLWAYNLRLPVIAADPAGKFVAVAGKEDDAIYVFSVAELAGNGIASTIQSQGARYRYASFVRAKDKVGLVLNESAKEGPGMPPRNSFLKSDAIFDFTKPGLTTTEGWLADNPKLTGWTVSGALEDKLPVLSIANSGKTTRITFKNDEQLTDWALLPPDATRKFAVVAVALLEVGEPALRLFRADSGQQIRQLTGHDSPIRSLAFSTDGKLLVSTGDDQTVRVWSLVGIEKASGLIGGLTVKGQNQVVVAKVEPGSSAVGKLAPGDVLQEIGLPGNKTQLLGTALQLYETLWARKAGEQVGIKVKDKGVVNFTLDPAVEEHHPLVTLFIDRAGKLEDREWLGWNPQGPYEASSPRAERFLGWHVNTGKTDAPVAYARAAKYSAKYEKPGILKQLVTKGALVQALDDLPKKALPDPKIMVTIGEEVLNPGRRDEKGLIPIQPRERILRVNVHDFPIDKLAALEWSIDGQALQAFGERKDNEWTATLPQGFDRGQHLVRIVARTPEARLPEYEQSWAVRYQPPPPKLTTTLPRRTYLDKEEFVVEANAQPGIDGEELAVEMTVDGGKAEPLTAPALKKSLKLGKGTHTIEIVARHKNALKGYEASETARHFLEVIYNPAAAKIALDEIAPLHGAQEGPASKIVPGETVIVEVPRVRIRGTVASAEALQDVQGNGKEVLGFKVGDKDLKFNETLDLKPGSQKWRLLAKSQNTAATQDLEILYQPKLPRLVYAPSPGGTTFYDEGKGRPEITLQFKLVAPTDAGDGPVEPFDAVTLINGKPQATKPVIDAVNRMLVVKLVPEAKDNDVQVQVRNKWREPTTTSVVPVRFLRPPHKASFIDPPAKSMNPVIQLKATVESSLPLSPALVEGTVNGNPIRNVRVEKLQGESWAIHLEGVSLNEARGSTNLVRLCVKNAEGACRAKAQTSVIYEGVPPKRPEIVILAPGNTNVTEPDVTVRFVVRSETPLTRAALVLEDGKTLQPLDLTGLPPGEELRLNLKLGGKGGREPVALSRLAPDAQGYRGTTINLALRDGLNRLRVEAANEGGDEAKAVVVTYQPQPIRVVIDQLEPAEGGLPVPYIASEARFASTASEGKMILRGRVIWGRESDDRLKKVEVVHLRVNGSRQVGGALLQAPTKDQPRERKFTAPLYFNQAADNRIHIDLPGLDLEETSKLEFVIDCAKPVQEKRLMHLLIVGVGPQDSDQLRSRLLRVFQARSISPREMMPLNYQGGLVYGPVVGEIEPDQVYYELANIQRRINLLATQGAFNNIVFVYFRGKEVLNEKGHFLATRLDSTDDDDSGLISVESLQKRTLETLGAQMLALDVNRDPDKMTTTAGSRSKDRIANQSVDLPIAVMRTVHLLTGKSEPPSYLLQAWENSWPKTRSLGQIAENVLVAMRTAQKANPETLLYDSGIPQSLRNLHVGPEGGAQ